MQSNARKQRRDVARMKKKLKGKLVCYFCGTTNINLGNKEDYCYECKDSTRAVTSLVYKQLNEGYEKKEQ